MIPDLAVIIAAYVCFRMIEVCLYKSDRYRSPTVHGVLCVLAALVILLTVFIIRDIVLTGSNLGTTPR